MDLVEQLKEYYKNDDDFMDLRVSVANIDVTLVGFQSLIDWPLTLTNLRQQTQHVKSREGLADVLEVKVGEPITQIPFEEAVAFIMNCGMIIRIEQGGPVIRYAPATKVLARSIEAPITENVLRGAVSAFNEDIETNAGLLKKHAASEHMRVQMYWVGKNQRKRLMLCYLDHRVDEKLLGSITRQIKANSGMDIVHLQALDRMLGLSKWTLVTKLNSTELPQSAAYAMEQGKAVLLLDRYPFAFVLPSLLWDMFDVENDWNFPLVLMYLIRMLRVLGVLMNVVIPGLYVALVSVNPDVLRIELALSIATSRLDVPYPAFVETIILLVILELILEASIRLPKSVGPTLTMVGGIIMGQAIVSAKLVSSLLIIVIAATTIASSTVAGFQNAISIRVFKYIILLLSAIYGIVGLLGGIVIVCGYLSSVTSFGIPYLHWIKPKSDANG